MTSILQPLLLHITAAAQTAEMSGERTKAERKELQKLLSQTAQATDVYSLGHGHLFVVLDRAHATDL